MQHGPDSSRTQGKPYEIGFTAAQYEGYVVNINNLITGYGGTIVNEDSTSADDRRQDRAGADAAAASWPPPA